MSATTATPHAEAPTRNAVLVWQDDVLVNIETGEIIDTAFALYDPLGERFCVDTMDKLEWVLERIQNRELEIEARARKRAILLQNLEAQDADDRRVLAGLHFRFDAEIEAFARATLEGAKTRTVKTAFGQVSFRLVRGTHKIIDMARAVVWAKNVAPAIVKVVESVNVSDVLPLLDDEEAPEWIEATPAEDRMHIKTGAVLS